MEKECKNCGSKFLGRPDRKFCTSKCKSIHNNAIYRNDFFSMKNTVNALRHNRTVLEKIGVGIQAKVYKKELLKAEGFDFNFVTGTYENNFGIRAYRLFEYEYFFVDGGALFSKFGN